MKKLLPTTLSRPAIVLLLLCAVAGSASAQRGKWITYVNPSIVSEIASKDGELFIATDGGLLVFQLADSTFEQFTNTIGLPSNFLTCLVLDGSGSIYVGTETSGVARLEPGGGGFDVTPLNATFHGLSDDRITSLTAWGDTIVYGTRAGAGLIISGFAGPRFLEKDGLRSEQVNDVFADGDFVWMGTDSGVVRLDRLGFLTDFSSGLPDLATRSLERAFGELWVGTSSGVARFDEGTGTWTPEGIGGENIFSLRFDSQTQTLWAGSRGRIHENDGTGWVSHGIFNMHVRYDLNSALTEIRGLQPMGDGTVFVGMGDPAVERRGANLLIWDGATIRDLPVNAPPMNVLLRLSFDLDESLWASSLNFGVGKLTPSGQWLNYNTAAGDTNLSNRFVNIAFLADSQGSKWFGGLSVPAAPVPMDELQDGFDTNRANDIWIHHDIGSGGGDGLGSLRGINAREDPERNRWFLSDEELSSDGWWGINILSADKSAWRQIDPTSTGGDLRGGNIIDAAFGPGGLAYVALRRFGVQMWFTGGYDQQNLFDLTNDSWLVLGEIGREFDSVAEIIALALRSDGVLWIGTTAGVYKWDNGFFTRHITANRGFGVGLLDNRVNHLALDRDENLWVATELGLNRIDKDDDNDIESFTTPVAWQTQLSLFFPPDVVSPLAHESCNALAVHPTRNDLYIATAGGLSILDISSLEVTSGSLSDVYVFPNPIRARLGHRELKIANISAPVNVEIYTLEGERVHNVDVVASEDVIWDLTTPKGILASSGVYLVRISNGSETLVTRVSLLQ